MTRYKAEVRVGQANAAILAGAEDLSLWTEEELLRGTRKDKNGKWSGRPPKIVPKAVHQELVQRRMLDAHSLLGENLVKAVQVLVDIATDKRADAAVRVKAASLIMDRVLGKVPDKVMLTEDPEPTWAKAIRAGMVQSLIPTAIPADSEDVDAPRPHGLRHVSGVTRNRRQREA